MIFEHVPGWVWFLVLGVVATVWIATWFWNAADYTDPPDEDEGTYLEEDWYKGGRDGS